MRALSSERKRRRHDRGGAKRRPEPTPQRLARRDSRSGIAGTIGFGHAGQVDGDVRGYVPVCGGPRPNQKAIGIVLHDQDATRPGNLGNVPAAIETRVVLVVGLWRVGIV